MAYIADFIEDGIKNAKNTDELYKLSQEAENAKQNPITKTRKARTKSMLFKKDKVSTFIKQMKSKSTLMDMLIEKALAETKK